MPLDEEIPCCRICGEPCPHCADEEDFMGRFPLTCQCDPADWSPTEPVDPVCELFKAATEGSETLDWCGTCGHVAECHRGSLDIAPWVQIAAVKTREAV